MPFSDAEITRLYERYAASLYRRARYVLDDPAHHNLVLEQTFVAALRQEGELRAATSPLAGLHQLQTKVLSLLPLVNRLAESTQRPSSEIERIWLALETTERQYAITRWIDRCSVTELVQVGFTEAQDAASRLDPFATHEGILPQNLGPSMLLVDRFACGELRGEARTSVQAWLTRDGIAAVQLEALKEARKQLPPLQLATLRMTADVAAPTHPTTAVRTVGALQTQPTLEISFDSEITMPIQTVSRADPSPADDNDHDDENHHDEDDIQLDLDPENELETPSHPYESAPSDTIEMAVRISPAPRRPARTPIAPTPNRRLPIGWALLTGLMLGALLYLVQSRDHAARTLPDAILSVQHDEKGDSGRLRFHLRAPSRESYTLLSVDAQGRVLQLTPEPQTSADRLASDGTVTGTVKIQESEEHRLIIAVVDSNIATATDRVATAFAAGGTAGVLAWIRTASDVDGVRWPPQ